MTNSLFKMNVIPIIHDFNINKPTTSFSYLIELFNLWYDGLEHVSFNALCKLINLDLMSKFHIDYKHKYEMCVEAKLAKNTISNY